MKTQYYTAASLDGFIAGPDHSLDWLLQFEMTDDYPAFVAQVGAIAMGSSTYEWIVNSLSGPTGEREKAWPYTQPVWVFTTRTLARIPDADVRFVQGDVAIVHEQMVQAAGDKNVWLVGGGDLAGQFHDKALLDELIVTVAPVVLGEGAPLLPRHISDPPLRLVSAETFGSTFAQLTYAVQAE